MSSRNFVKAAITVLYSKTSNRILVGQKKINSLYLSNSLGFPGAIVQPGSDDCFDYRRTNLDITLKNNIYKSDAYGRSIAAARGLFMESGILITTDDSSQKQKLVTINDEKELESYRKKVEYSPSIFKDLFVSTTLDVRSFVPLTRLQLTTNNNISYDIEVFGLLVSDTVIGEKLTNNVGEFKWISADTIPKLKEIFSKKDGPSTNDFHLPLIQKVSNIDKLNNAENITFENLVSRMNVATKGGSHVQQKAAQF
uniref:Nudix hydrolase domain-containing protein n=1 Tax=Parastrongyloides trichosuri TaxID=131310 RepID=A0A0N4Z139_PARTI